jgi:preprotein translocase subunit SecG
MEIGQIIIVALVALLTIAVCIIAGILLVRTFSGEATPAASSSRPSFALWSLTSRRS